jgi:hypothetical protein
MVVYSSFLKAGLHSPLQFFIAGSFTALSNKSITFKLLVYEQNLLILPLTVIMQAFSGQICSGQ